MNRNDTGAASNTKNLFHIITLNDSQVAGCTRLGQIKSWEFKIHCRDGWEITCDKSAGFPSPAGFGCRKLTHEVAGNIASWFMDRGSHSEDWSNIVETFPELQYMVPSDAIKFRRLLLDGYGLQVLVDPDSPDEIQLIGKSVRGGG